MTTLAPPPAANPRLQPLGRLVSRPSRRSTHAVLMPAPEDREPGSLGDVSTLVPLDRVLLVVRPQQERRVRALGLWPRENLVLEPADRGSASSLLLALLTLARRDPAARVLIHPPSLRVDEQPHLGQAMRTALQEVERHSGSIVLVGSVPGPQGRPRACIVPESGRTGGAVRAFVGASAPEAISGGLRQGGCLWHHDILAGTLPTLLGVLGDCLPRHREALARALAFGSAVVGACYRDLVAADLEASVLSRSARALRVVAIDAPGRQRAREQPA